MLWALVALTWVTVLFGADRIWGAFERMGAEGTLSFVAGVVAALAARERAAP